MEILHLASIFGRKFHANNRSAFRRNVQLRRDAKMISNTFQYFAGFERSGMFA